MLPKPKQGPLGLGPWVGTVRAQFRGGEIEIFFGKKKQFVRKQIFQTVFWINWGSGEHEEKFLEVERRRKR